MRVYEDLGWPVNDDSSMTCAHHVSASHHVSDLCSPRYDGSLMTYAHHELCSPRVASHLRSLTKRMPPMLTKRMPPMLTKRMHSPTSGR